MFLAKLRDNRLDSFRSEQTRPLIGFKPGLEFRTDFFELQSEQNFFNDSQLLLVKRINPRVQVCFEFCDRHKF